MANLRSGLGGSAGFGENFLARNDDSFTSFIDLRSIFGVNGINFFGQQYTGLFLNNNGSVTFSIGRSTYTPTAITGDTSNPIIAPFWADVDTRNPVSTTTIGGTSAGSNLLWYDLDIADRAFTATWDDVGFFDERNDKLNAFQLRLVKVGTSGDFDIEFRYESINWVTGDLSGGTDGFGGVPARAGYSSGNGVNFFELSQSGNQAALLALEATSNVGEAGIYRFSVRSGSASPSISVSSVEVLEGNSANSRFAFIPVSLAAPSAQTITVQYTTGDGTAVAGNDYVAQSGLLTFAPGVTEQTIFVEILGDLTVEPNESFFVTLRNPVNAPIGNVSSAITIANDDGVAIGDVSQLEGTGATPTAFVFNLSLPTAQLVPVSVQYATEAGTAGAGGDFEPATGTVVFAPGETSKTITVNVVADTATEADETFTVRLFGATGAPIANATGIGTIVNDDGIVINDLAVVEGTGTGTTSAQMTVRLLSAAPGPVSVNWATVAGTALAGSDFAQSSGSVSFAAGETSRLITIPILRDAVAEGEEALRVVLSTPTGAAIVDSEATLRILDDDGFSISDAVVTEGQSGTSTMTFTVSLGSALASAAQVTVTTANGTATAASDFGGGALVLTFDPGVTSRTVDVFVTGDTTPEADETLSLVLSNPVGAQIVRGSATGTIFNDDGISITNITVNESPSRNVTMTVSLSGASAVPVTFSYQTQDGTATAGLDYQATSGTLTFAPGERTKTINIAITDDAIFEGSETFRVIMTAGTNATLVDGIGTVTITNDDVRPLPSIGVADAGISEGSGSGSTFLRFQVALSEVLSGNVTANFTTFARTATENADFTPTSGVVTIEAGSRFAFISVPVIRDSVIEAAEVVEVRLSNPSANVSIARAMAVGTIANDDVQFSIGPATVSGAEGNAGTSDFTFIVSRIGDTLDNATINWQVAGSGSNQATAVDFQGGALPSGQVIFASGELSKAIVVTVIGDTAVELDESFIVRLSNPTPIDATIANATAAGTILNDDASLAIVATSGDQTEGNSGSKAFTFTVTRSGSTAGTSTANWAVTGSGLSPANAADFASGLLPSGSVSFAPGEPIKTITVNVSGDAVFEPDNDFTVTLSAPSIGTSLTAATAFGAIRNDDTGTEGNDTLNGGPGNDLIDGRGGNDRLVGAGGNDILIGGLGGDALDGGEGFDTASYAAAASGVLADLVVWTLNTGEAAGDSYTSVEGLLGSAFGDDLRGTGGDNVIFGNAGADFLYGRGGNDTLEGGLGGDFQDGGDGFDYVSYAAATSGVLADLVVWTSNIGEASGDVYTGIEGILGSGFNDDLRGTGGDNWIYGGAGSDIAYGRAGNDVLIGEAGDDTLWGNEGNDALYGGEGLDRLLSGAGADLLNGEGGFDFAHYDDATSGITVDLASNAFNAGGAQGDQLFNVEGVVGSFFADRLLGDGITNWLYGVDGNDVIDGRGGDDVLIAGNGNDIVFGGDGNDLMFGEIGDDILLGGNSDDRMDGGAGNDTLTGGAGADVLIGNIGFDYVAYEGAAAGVTVDLVAWGNNSGEAAGDQLIEVEGIIGSGFNDSLRGDAGANFLYGLGGADFIFGRGGNDVLIGGDGDDTLFGNDGNDAIYGGAGNDRIVFGSGDGRDSVYEFAAGAGVGDVIQLAASLGITSFTQLQGRMSQVGADTLISFDAATAITIIGVAPGALAPNDFIFG